MRKIIQLFADNLRILVFIYFIIQVIILFNIPFSYSSDSLYNYNLAQQCLNSHSFYPMPVHLYQDYIIAPLYINILILVLSIFNSPLAVGFLNIFLNLIQLFFVYRLSEKLFNRNAAKVAAILYVFYLSTLGLILMNLTELSFGCLILGSIYFYLRKNSTSYFIAGILAAASIGIRPLGWSLIVIFVSLTFYQIFMNKDKKPLMILAGIIFFILLFGSFAYSSFGRFVFTSNNGPINILIGANKNATGAYNANVFDKGNVGYIDSSQTKTFYEKENYWRNQAGDWIIKHPIKWISLFPLKIVYMFTWDDFSVSHLFDYGKWNLYRVLKKISVNKSFRDILSGMPVYEKIIYVIVQVLHHLYYFLLLIIFFFFILQDNKKLFLNEGILIIISFIMLCLFMNLATFGDARFKYPYLIMIIILISPKVYESINIKYFNNEKRSAKDNA
ncbi:MAG: ArnT family glycosyltransferase [Ignavibacteriaceae bacterium]